MARTLFAQVLRTSGGQDEGRTGANANLKGTCLRDARLEPWPLGPPARGSAGLGCVGGGEGSAASRSRSAGVCPLMDKVRLGAGKLSGSIEDSITDLAEGCNHLLSGMDTSCVTQQVLGACLPLPPFVRWSPGFFSGGVPSRLSEYAGYFRMYVLVHLLRRESSMRG